MKIIIPNGFKPRPYQVPIMRYLDNHAEGGRAVWVVHRRGGKDLTALHQTCKMMHRRKGTYWLVYPTETQGRRSIWTEFTGAGERMMEQVFPAAIRKAPKTWSPQAEMFVELKCGSTWRLLGSDKIEVVGAGPIGAVFSEYAIAKPKTWDFVRPMIRERNGWAAFISTPRGKNHLWDRWQEAVNDPTQYHGLFSLYDTRAYDPERTIKEERAAGMPEELIRQEYLCDWTAANVGAVFGGLVEGLEKRGGVVDFAHPSDGVFTTWDLGFADATAIWFWRLNKDRMPDIIDHYEASGRPLSHFFDTVEQRGYKYVKHWLPHDARAHELTSGVSRIEMFVERWGMESVGIVPELSIADGIQAGRWLLQQPMRIHGRCKDGLGALKAYHYIFDEERKVLSTKPEHDWSSNTADAFRYLALVVRHSDLITRVTEEKPKGPYAVPADRSMTLDELFEARERERKRWGSG